MRLHIKAILACSLIVASPSHCDDDAGESGLGDSHAPRGQEAAEFDIYAVGRGFPGMSLSIELAADGGRRRLKAEFYGKDHIISCKLHDSLTGEECSARLTSEQIAILNDSIRKELSRTVPDEKARDRLIWDKWEEDGYRRYEIPISIGSQAPVVAVFNRIIELSRLPKYDVKPGDTLMSIARDLLGDSGRWREIRDVNPQLHEDGRNLNHAFDIRVPRK